LHIIKLINEINEQYSDQIACTKYIMKYYHIINDREFEYNDNKLTPVQELLNYLAGIGFISNSKCFMEFIEHTGIVWPKSINKSLTDTKYYEGYNEILRKMNKKKSSIVTTLFGNDKSI